MKKILALILSLMLLLPAIALGEAASNPDQYTVEFEDFTITVNAEDILQKGEKAEQQILFMLFPKYDETSSYHANINALWTAEDLGELGTIGAQTFGEMVLSQSQEQLSSQGIAASNAQLISAEFDEETRTTVLITSMDADYTGAGIDLKMNLCQMQMYIPMGDIGSYIFTLSADSLEGLDELLKYMDNIDFNE